MRRYCGLSLTKETRRGIVFAVLLSLRLVSARRSEPQILRGFGGWMNARRRRRYHVRRRGRAYRISILARLD